MQLTYYDTEYWKVIDTFERTYLDHHRLKHLKAHACLVFQQWSRQIGKQDKKSYLIGCLSYDAFSREWHTINTELDANIIDNDQYYHLTGTLDISDYNSVKEETENVSVYILAPKPENVLAYSSYWPEYDKSGNKQWHWIAGPYINRVKDEQDVIRDRIERKLSGVVSQHAKIDLVGLIERTIDQIDAGDEQNALLTFLAQIQALDYTPMIPIEINLLEVTI